MLDILKQISIVCRGIGRSSRFGSLGSTGMGRTAGSRMWMWAAGLADSLGSRLSIGWGIRSMFGICLGMVNIVVM